MTEISAKILLVDDDRQTRLKLSRTLEGQGHDVSAVDGGRVALEILADQSFDLILLDVLMPELDGFEVLRSLKADERMSAIPVIVVSALEGKQPEEMSKRLGAEAYVTKPVDAEVLNAQILACLGRGGDQSKAP